jgi:repressor of nif and glnA expression
MDEKAKRKKLAILRILKKAEKPLSSNKITVELANLGMEISERSVRLYLQQLDQDGFTINFGRRGRQINEAGLNELDASGIMERVGFLSAKIDQMTYRMNFDLDNRSGTVVINFTLVKPDELLSCAEKIKQVFAQGYAMGKFLTLLPAGEHLGGIVVPQGLVGVGTVCSITLNGVLLQHGIPTTSRFGGLLELQNRKATRFVEIITYEGTSIDPLEVFIRSGMTNYLGAIQNGNGRIGASFREYPSASRHLVEKLATQLDKAGFGGFMCLGRPGLPLLEIPVSEGRFGAVVIGGLNPVSILEETGHRVFSRALAGLVDFGRLFHYEELTERVKLFSKAG